MNIKLLKRAKKLEIGKKYFLSTKGDMYFPSKEADVTYVGFDIYTQCKVKMKEGKIDYTNASSLYEI